MKIDAEYFFTNRSIIRKDAIFAHMFKLAPSVYACTLDEEGKKIDMYNANKKLIQSFYPNSDVFNKSVRHLDDETSCVTEERNKGCKKIG